MLSCSGHVGTLLFHCQLRGFEMVKHVHLESDLFSVDNGMLTPTMKLKRAEGKAK